MTIRLRVVLAFSAAWAAVSPAGAQQAGWRAGAAKVDITPDAASLAPGDIIRDPLFVRAIVIGGDEACAVLAGADLGGLTEQVARQAIADVSAVTGCPQENIILSATHTHSAAGSARLRAGPGAGLGDAIVKAVTMAKAAMKPATIGYGTTQVDLNINRDLFSGNRWMQGPNPDGPSDKTLAVLEVLGKDGLPIGVYLNYAIHPINFYMSGVVSGDVPGEASRYIERRYGPAMVAIFAQGAAGDQNPKLTRPQNKLARIRTGVAGAADMRVIVPATASAGDESESMARRMAALASTVPEERKAEYLAAVEEVGEVVSASGVLLGESAISLMHRGAMARVGSGPIKAATRTLQCPGRDRMDRENPVREGALPPYADGALVTIRAGMLRIGDIYISSIDGEVYSDIASRLKQAAPVSRLMMTSLANGAANSGYIYSDQASGNLTFQVIGSRLHPGCAENAIVTSALEMIGTLR